MQSAQIQPNNSAQTQPGPANSKAAPAMGASRIIKLMLVRIGDEKRDLIEQHLGVLRGKCVDVQNHEADTAQSMQQTLCAVVHNLPHKVFLYATLVALIAQESPAVASDLVSSIVNSLKQVFVNDQDAFKSRNIFRFLSYLVDLKVICAKAACQFLLSILDEGEKAGEAFQRDLVLHCILVFLTTQNTSQRLQKESGIDFGSVVEALKNQFKTRNAKHHIKQQIFGLTTPDSLAQLFNFFTQNQAKSFPQGNVYLNVSAQKTEEVKNSFGDSPLKNLPQISIINEFKQRKIDFDSQLQKALPPKRYHPLFFEIPLSAGEAVLSFETYSLHQLCCDVIFAFQEDYKQAYSTLLKLYVGESLAGELHDQIANAVLTYVLNVNDNERHYTLQSQNSPQKIVFFAQIINFIKQDLLETGEQFMKNFSGKLVACCQKYDFNTSGEGHFLQNLMELQVFLNSQQEKEVVNNDFLNSLQAAIKDADAAKFKRIIHFYLSFCCKFGYHKQVRDTLSEQFHEFLPGQNILKPVFGNVKVGQKREEDMKSDESLSDDQVQMNSDVDAIMAGLSKKGNIIEPLRELLADRTKVKSTGLQLKQMFLEILFTKYGAQSLEHVTRGIERVKPILVEHYGGQAESQRMAIGALLKAFNVDVLAAQNYAAENLFQLRSKVLSIIERLIMLQIVDSEVVIDWCIEKLQAHAEGLGAQVPLETLHCQLILCSLKRAQEMREHLVNKFRQDVDKPGEVKQETPYEQRERAKRLEMDKDYKPSEQPAKTAEEIDAEKAEIEKDYRNRYQQAYESEVSIHETTLAKLFADNSSKNLKNLADKVLLLSNHWKMSSTRFTNSKIKNEQLELLLKN